MEICMRKGEVDLFKSTLDQSNGYLEYGCGGSTVYVANNTSAEIHTVDSVQDWINKIKKAIGPRPNITYDMIDIGPTESFGRPAGKSKINNWPSYSDAILRCSFVPDTVMIDGRFRVASCLKVIKYFSQLKIKTNPTILFHDITRSGFETAFIFLDTIQRENELACFKIKENVDLNELNKLITQYECNFG